MEESKEETVFSLSSPLASAASVARAGRRFLSPLAFEGSHSLGTADEAFIPDPLGPPGLTTPDPTPLVPDPSLPNPDPPIPSPPNPVPPVPDPPTPPPTPPDPAMTATTTPSPYSDAKQPRIGYLKPVVLRGGHVVQVAVCGNNGRLVFHQHEPFRPRAGQMRMEDFTHDAKVQRWKPLDPKFHLEIGGDVTLISWSEAMLQHGVDNGLDGCFWSKDKAGAMKHILNDWSHLTLEDLEAFENSTKPSVLLRCLSLALLQLKNMFYEYI